MKFGNPQERLSQIVTVGFWPAALDRCGFADTPVLTLGKTQLEREKGLSAGQLSASMFLFRSLARNMYLQDLVAENGALTSNSCGLASTSRQLNVAERKSESMVVQQSS